MGERMSYSTVLKVHDIFLQAFANDPIQHYLWEDSMTIQHWKTRVRVMVRRIRMANKAATALRTGLALQVGGGKGFVLAWYAKADLPPTGVIVNALSWLTALPGKAYDRLVFPILSTQQQRRRGNEIETKMESTISRVLGEDASQYMYLDVLACAPELQGKGLGKALVRAITDVADSKQRKVWLLSGNIKNHHFYRSCGFEVVEELTLDASPPVVVEMMIYEPRQR
ncbi:hypothetical protein PENSPDRAFT_655537 [Peniophora sp. CONT]|nr:hypothetical protein PENSPDRAFT_655537 [Peniophora sp. CONT]